MAVVQEIMAVKPLKNCKEYDRLHSGKVKESMFGSIFEGKTQYCFGHFLSWN
jgi:hypothetical protein